MDEIAALSVWQRDDLHRGIFAARRGEPFDEYETTHWKLGWLLYLDTHQEQDEGSCTLY